MSITLEQVLKAYEYAESHPHKYLRGTTNWCAAVAHSLNERMTHVVERQPVAISEFGQLRWLGHQIVECKLYTVPLELQTENNALRLQCGGMELTIDELQATIEHLRNDLEGTRLLAADQLLKIKHLMAENEQHE